MKMLNGVAFVCSLLCIVTSSAQHDFTEMLAWFIVAMYNFKELIYISKS